MHTCLNFLHCSVRCVDEQSYCKLFGRLRLWLKWLYKLLIGLLSRMVLPCLHCRSTVVSEQQDVIYILSSFSAMPCDGLACLIFGILFFEEIISHMIVLLVSV